MRRLGHTLIRRELPNRRLVAFVKQIAAEEHIQLQFDFVPGFGDDAGAIKLNDGGVR